MKSTSLPPLAAALTLALSACGGGHPPTAKPGARLFGTLEFQPCALSTANSRKALEAQCATLQVPENPARPQGRKIGLKIAWLTPENEAGAMPDPVFMLAGGPGQSALQSYPQLDPAFADVRKQRHVILVDQRGTGGSNPLTCQQDDEETPNFSPERAAAYARQCLSALEKRADPRFYTTTDAVRDLDAVRQALGVEKINLMGVSYGTRVAQQYALRHPQHTRTVLLDSVVPNTLPLGNIFARNLDDALALQFGQCAKDTACREKLGDPRAQLDTLLAKLKADPPLVRYRDANTHAPKEARLTAESVAGLVRMYAYMPAAASLLPVLIHEANQGRYEGLMALTKMLTGEMRDAMALGMQMSVICSEDAGSFDAREEDKDTVLGQDMARAMGAMCEVWPVATQVPKDFRAPLTGGIPVLAISGEFDPVTPPRYGDVAIAKLSNARHLVLKGQGHSVLGTGCMPKLFAQFVDKAEPKALDAKCLDTLGPVPPFTSFNGWNP
ncbi:alpha/beta fold hydrolase [Lysobacter pythonis]|uniref:Alpha/beta fold hydrolase n=1 Tax=Solilutibacter pythonis TaxID=2483112 RepID=A0A3M2I6D1_9GAMM|nr:alpha/beta fold hydrolase [Lysobacter pythonis]RMH93834.1 alpha/beta fold hydrolase [Lysobacter pythonis]